MHSAAPHPHPHPHPEPNPTAEEDEFGSEGRLSPAASLGPPPRRKFVPTTPGSASRSALQRRTSIAVEEVYEQERQSLLSALSSANRKVVKLQAEKDVLAARVSKVQGDHAKEVVLLRSKYEGVTRDLNSSRSTIKELTTCNDELLAASSQIKLDAAESVRAAETARCQAEKALASEVELRQQLERDVEEYRRKLVSRGQDVLQRDEELAGERRVFEARLLRANQKVDALQRQIRSNRDVQALEDRLKAAHAQIDSLTSKNAMMTSELSMVHRRLDTVSAERVPELESEVSSLRQQLQHTQWTLDRTREAADKSQRLADQLEEDNRRLQQALMDTQADLALLESAGQAEIQKQVAMVERRLSQDPSALQAMQEALRDRDALRETAAALEGTVKDATLEIERLQGELLLLRAEADRCKEALALTENQRDDAVQSLQSSSNDGAALAGQLQSMVDDWREAEDRWGKDLAALRDQLHSKDLELEKTFTLASDLNKQREDLVHVVQQLTTAEQGHCNNIASLSAQLGHLRATHAAMAEEREMLIAERREHLRVIEAMAQERSHQTRVFDTLTAKLSTGSVMPVGAGSGGASGSATVGGYSSTRGGSTPARHVGYAK